MPNWESRLVVKFTDDLGAERTISPIDTFTPTFNLAAEAMHSIEQTHIGVIYSTKQMTFSIGAKAIGDVTARLTKLGMDGTPFQISLQESADGTDWSFESVVMTDCVITSCSPSNATATGAPSVTFSGFCLSSTVTSRADAALTPVTVP